MHQNTTDVTLSHLQFRKQAEDQNIIEYHNSITFRGLIERELW